MFMDFLDADKSTFSKKKNLFHDKCNDQCLKCEECIFAWRHNAELLK